MPARGTRGFLTDPTKQLPVMVGDYVTYSGTVFKIDPTLPATAANTYISAHTAIFDVGVYTAPGVPPCYVAVDVLLMGVNGQGVAGIGTEVTTRTRVEGFTTDPSRFIDIYAVDVHPITGGESLRLLATTDPLTQAVRGRFRFFVQGGSFPPPTREVLVKSKTGQSNNVANGLTGGQYRLPDFTFLFPEHLFPGQPQVPANFEDFPFLALGSGPLGGPGSGGPIVGQLDPWPGAVAPPKAVAGNNGLVPIASAGPNLIVGSAVPVRLAGTVTLDPASNILNGGGIQWTALTPGAPQLAQSNTMSPSFTAPTIVVGGADQQFVYQLKVTDKFGTGTSPVSVTVKAVTDTVSTSTATWRAAQKGGDITVTSLSSDPTAILSAVMFFADGTTMQLGSMGPPAPGKPGAPVVPGVAVKLTAVPQPVLVIVHSSLGGQETAALTIR
jgi:hypothetical protein